jgi:hypothetical protein
MCANAHIALQMDYYNSEDSASMSLEGANLAFDSFCTLEPHSLTYSNGGSSNKLEAEYSYSLTLNGDTMFSSAKTDSGMFGWSGNVDAGGDLGLNSLKVSTRSAVKDGSLNIAYGNDKFKVQEKVEAENSGYLQQAQLGPGTVASVGSGSTLQPVTGLAENLKARSTNQASSDTASNSNQESLTSVTDSPASSDAGSSPESAPASSESQSQGIKYSINVQNVANNKQGSLDADVMGPTEAQWFTQVKSDSDAYLFGVKMRGISFAPIDKLDMIGQATGFPLQILPPGNVEISYIDKTIPETPEAWEKYPGLVDTESQDFDSAYAGKSTPALWYYLDNVNQKEVPVDLYYTPNSLMPLEQYQLSMAFMVKGK